MKNATREKSKENEWADGPEADAQKMTGAEMVIKALRTLGVEHLFGYPGGAVLPLYDVLFQQNEITHILSRHEQGAVHAAEGYTKATGRTGVVFVTSGPGATNTVTGLANALADSTPLVCITGQVPTALLGTNAFQEADIIGITKCCTKQNYQVKDINDLIPTIFEAFRVARSGRPGPVLIDLPKDVQLAAGVYNPPETASKTYRPRTQIDQNQIKRVVSMLAEAQRPIVYTGGGVINAGPCASDLLRRFVRATGFPCTSTLMGLGAYPTSDRQFLGMLGMHGTYEANMAMHACDVMLNIGARFDDRVTGNVEGFSPNSKKIHIDVDPTSINKCVKVDVGIVGDAGDIVEEMLRCWKDFGERKQNLSSWWERIEADRQERSLSYSQDTTTIKPQYALERLRELTSGEDVYFTTEVGQHQMWAAQFLRFDAPNRLITSGGLGTMGFGLPAAIGVQIARPKSLVVDVAGDASLMMNIQEICTAVQHKLPIKVFILNNRWMGMVRQWQELVHGRRYSQSSTEAQPDFVRLAEAFGAAGLRVTRPRQMDEAIQQMLKIKDRPCIVDICVDPFENCFPMIPAGKNHNEMILGNTAKELRKRVEKTCYAPA